MHPGAEHHTESWQGEADVGVRVCFKMLGRARLELADLAVQFGDDADSGRVVAANAAVTLPVAVSLDRGADWISRGAGGDIAVPPTTF